MENGSEMSKKIQLFKIVVVLIAPLFIAGIILFENIANPGRDQTVQVSVIGPNNISDSSFYRIVKNTDEFPNGAIVKNDVVTASDTIIYIPDKYRIIYGAVECGEGVLVEITNSIKSYSLIYIDENDEPKTVFESEYGMAFTKVNGRVLVHDLSTCTYLFDPDTYELYPVETDDIEDDALYTVCDNVSGRYHSMQNGTKVTLRKSFGENNFIFESGHNVIPVDCISGENFKYAQWGYLSDKDGILYGVAAIPKKESNLRWINVGIGYLATDHVVREVLYSIDVKSGENKVLFESRGARIVGYTDSDVYLYRKGTVYKRNIASGTEEQLGGVTTERKAHLEFRWVGDKMFVFDSFTGTLITVIQDKRE